MPDSHLGTNDVPRATQINFNRGTNETSVADQTGEVNISKDILVFVQAGTRYSRSTHSRVAKCSKCGGKRIDVRQNWRRRQEELVEESSEDSDTIS
jgi:hypothetical protein